MDTPAIATQIECPYCSEQINARSKKCRHCGEILDPQMREIEMLKSSRASPSVFMNAGGGGGGGAAASSSSSAGAASGGEPAASQLRKFPHGIHIVISLLTGFMWLPVYILLYFFINKNYYR